MAPVKERLLRLSVAHYHNENVTDQEFHKWVTENHCARVAPICQRHGVVSYGMVSPAQLNRHLKVLFLPQKRKTLSTSSLLSRFPHLS